jgi:hypothetical protein
MSDPRDDLSDALHRLRGEVRQRVPMPAAAQLRTRAIHRLRVRRTATALVAAVAVAALVVGGNSLLNATAAPPGPPADTPTPSPPVPPSPRPSPRPPEPSDDPITEVDWRTATITIPSHEGCPSGPITFAQDPGGHGADWAAYGPGQDYPRLVIDAGRRPHGDLTGDDRAEAVISATCFADAEDSGDGQGQLLVVTRTEGGDLQALPWVGPRGAIYPDYWVADGYLYAEVYPHLGEEFDWLPWAPLRYRWDGVGFDGPELAPDYPAIVSEDGGAGAPVRPGAAVASGLGCPDRELRFAAGEPASEEPPLIGYAAAAGDATYTVSESPTQHLFDLDNTGARLLVTPLACTRADGTTTVGLAVFEPAGDGWRGISVLVTPAVVETGDGTVAGDVPSEWELTQAGHLSVVWQAANRDRVMAITQYRWTGTVFEPIVE